MTPPSRKEVSLQVIYLRKILPISRKELPSQKVLLKHSLYDRNSLLTEQAFKTELIRIRLRLLNYKMSWISNLYAMLKVILLRILQ